MAQRCQRQQPFRPERRHPLRQQPVDHRRRLPAEVREKVVVQRHAAAQPADAIVLLRQSFELARAAHTLDTGIQPQSQHHPRIGRRPARRVRPSLDLTIQIPQIDLLDVSPDRPRRMTCVNQTIEFKTLEHDRIALRLDVARQPRITINRFVPCQLAEQSALFIGHRDLPLETPNQIHTGRTSKKSQTLSEAKDLSSAREFAGRFVRSFASLRTTGQRLRLAFSAMPERPSRRASSSHTDLGFTPTAAHRVSR